MPADDGSRSGEVDPPDDTHDIIREEARYVIDEQLQTLRDTDQKALATARITGLILGLLVSAFSIADDPVGLIHPTAIIGAAVLIASLCISVLTYTVDRPSYGIGPGYIDIATKNLDSRDDAQNDLLARYADWIDDNSAEISTNGTYLFISQLLFILGLLLIGYAAYDLI